MQDWNISTSLLFWKSLSFPETLRYFDWRIKELYRLFACEYVSASLFAAPAEVLVFYLEINLLLGHVCRTCKIRN
jgi:hypothetical protein